jgi:hypothetical protein
MAVFSAKVTRQKVTVYFNQDIYEWLNERADREVRSVGNLVEYLIVQQKKEEEAKSKKKEN